MPPFVLKFKTNKPFDPLTDTLDAEALRRTWNVCTKVANCLEQGSRLENLTWRLWHMERQSESLKLREVKNQKEREAFERFRREEQQRLSAAMNLDMSSIHSPQPRHAFPSPNSIDWSSAPPPQSTLSSHLSPWPTNESDSMVPNGLSPMDSSQQFSPFGFSPSYASPPVSQAQLASSMAFALSPTSFFNTAPDPSVPMFHSSYGAYQPISGPYSRFLTPSPEPSLLGSSLEDLERDLSQFRTSTGEQINILGGNMKGVTPATIATVGTTSGVQNTFDNMWSSFDLGKGNENGMSIDPFAGMTIAGMSRGGGTTGGIGGTMGGRPIFEVETEVFDQRRAAEEDERKTVIRELEEIGRRGSNFQGRNENKTEQEMLAERERMEIFERAMRGLTPPQGYTSFDYQSQSFESQNPNIYQQSPASLAQPLPPLQPIASTSSHQYPTPVSNPQDFHHQQQLQHAQQQQQQQHQLERQQLQLQQQIELSQQQQQQQQQLQASNDYARHSNEMSRLASTSLADMRQWAHLQEAATLGNTNTPSTSDSSSKPSPPSPPPQIKKVKGVKKGGLSAADRGKNKKFKNPHSTQLPAGSNESSTDPTDDSSICSHCASTRTPLWRRGPADELLCNACGLYLKLHGTPRPKVFATQPIGVRGRLTTGAAAQAAASLTPPQCLNCEATSTPMWRKDAQGKLCCNACSLYFKLHNRVRPTSLSKKRKGSEPAPEAPAAVLPTVVTSDIPLAPPPTVASSFKASPPVAGATYQSSAITGVSYQPSPPLTSTSYQPSPPLTSASYQPSPPLVGPAYRASPSMSLSSSTPTPPTLPVESPLPQALQQHLQSHPSPSWQDFHSAVDRPPVFHPLVTSRPQLSPAAAPLAQVPSPINRLWSPAPTSASSTGTLAEHHFSRFSVPISNDRSSVELDASDRLTKRPRTASGEVGIGLGRGGGGGDWTSPPSTGLAGSFSPGINYAVMPSFGFVGGLSK